MKQRLIAFFVLVGFFSPISNLAQNILLPFDRVTSHDAIWQLYESHDIVHFSYKPILISKAQYDTVVQKTYYRYNGKEYKKWLGRKVFRENLVVIRAKDLYITIDPVFNFEVANDFADTSNTRIYTNTRGYLIQGHITDKVYFRTDFYESQSQFPSYIDSMILSSGTVPGQSKAKPFKNGAVDYPMVTGLIHFQATHNFNIQFGQDKLFIGNGYRSLLLSDNTSPFLFLQMGWSFWKNKLNYHANWASLQTLHKIQGTGGGGDQLFAKKQANFNYLSLKPCSNLELGVFEGVIWERWNEHTLNQPFDPVFINPIPLLTTALKRNDTLVGSVLGTNIFIKPTTHIGVYGQLSYGVSRGGVGFQLGTKWHDALQIKGLNLQAEYNWVGTEVYGNQNHYTDYFHYNQPLSVQQMDDFTEIVLLGSYRHKRLLISVKTLFADVNRLTQTSKKINNYEASIAYILNPITNALINIGMRWRDDELMGTTQWFYFGVKTNLRNIYYDF